jgi:tRNA (guanine-N7-)-methyltransferase
VSGKNKLLRFAENLALPNVFENYSFDHPILYRSYNESIDYKGQWNHLYFKNENPITIELACGGGEYCLGLSDLFPQKNFIGIDIKGARLWKGAKLAFESNNKQIAFVRTKIELISHFFDQKEIQEIWITFPDPFLKNSKSNKRLTSPHYLNIYKSILKPESILHLKTDDQCLYDFTIQSIKNDSDFQLVVDEKDIYSLKEIDKSLQLKTHYETKHLQNGKSIKYIQFKYLGK